MDNLESFQKSVKENLKITIKPKNVCKKLNLSKLEKMKSEQDIDR